MQTNQFDLEFEKITTAMVEIAFEFVDFNKDIIDTIFILGSIEDEIINYKFFYNINGVYLSAYKINENQQIEFDISDERLSAIQRLGNNELQKMNTLFLNHKRNVPTLCKILFFPKSGKFECKLNYDLQYSNSDMKGFHDIFLEWLDEQKIVQH